jgi:GAF domain-containing protein/GGDEF domain-containing protein
MGLLEKALQFKNELNSRGRETLIDKIIGPAQTDMMQDREASAAMDGPGSIAGGGHDGREPEDEIIFLSETELDAIEKDELPSTMSDGGRDGRESGDEGGRALRVAASDDDEFFDRSIDGDDAIDIAGAAVPDERRENAVDTFITGLFSDYLVLYEACREINKSKDIDNFFEVLSFLVMGQIGVSSSALLLENNDNSGKWRVAQSRGIVIDNKDIDLSSFKGILSNLLHERRIVDVEDYSGDERVSAEFYKYISIDARLLVPLAVGPTVVGVITLGDKITAESYTDEERDYLYAIAEFSAAHLDFILKSMSAARENEALEKGIAHIRDADAIIARVRSNPDIKFVRETVQNEFRSMGIECFGVFMRAPGSDRFMPLIHEREDLLLFGELEFSIRARSHFLSFLQEGLMPCVIDDIVHSRIIAEVFNDIQAAHLNIFRAYPFRVGNEIPGFILIGRVADMQRLDEIDLKVERIALHLFPLMISFESVSIKRKKYIDNVEIIYKRIEDEIANARNLDIPVTLILFSIKNYKRYYNLFGIDEAKKLVELFEKTIRTRLSDGDFSVRYDRHKVLMVLPGKDKKFAVPLANAIRNEVVQGFRKKELQLLITFLTAEFPEDGNNVYSLIDAID